MKDKKIIIFGGGTAMSIILQGLKKFPFDITAVVTVSDDGSSSGRLREEFNTPAVGDLRRVIVSLSETEPLVEKVFNYRFKTNSDLDGHTVGNLLLTATSNITGNLNTGIETLSKILNLKGRVLPLTEDNAILMAKVDGNKTIEGEANITKETKKIKKIYYKKTPKVTKKVLSEIKKAELIIFSAGSLYTSIIPHLLCKEIKESIDSTKAPLVYISNIMTQPGETDKFSVSDHIKILNKYLGKRKINIVFANNKKINQRIIKTYSTKEQKDPVLIDEININKINTIIKKENYIKVENGILRHNSEKLALDIYSYLLLKK